MAGASCEKSLGRQKSPKNSLQHSSLSLTRSQAPRLLEGFLKCRVFIRGPPSKHVGEGQEMQQSMPALLHAGMGCPNLFQLLFSHIYGIFFSLGPRALSWPQGWKPALELGMCQVGWSAWKGQFCIFKWSLAQIYSDGAIWAFCEWKMDSTFFFCSDNIKKKGVLATFRSSINCRIELCHLILIHIFNTPCHVAACF